MSPPADAGADRLRWTGRAFVVLGLGAVLAVVAIATRSVVPLFVGLPLLVAPFALAALGTEPPERADLYWTAEGIGPELSVTGRVEGAFGRSAGDVVLVPELPVGARTVDPLAVVPGRDAVRFTARWRLAEPAIATVPAPRVLWRDPLGLVERPIDGDRPALLVSRYPAELRRLDAIRLDRTVLLPGDTRSRRVGTGGEFFGVREASPDEPLRRINWRASARVGRLLANDYQLELTGDLLLLLDVRPGPDDPRTDARLLNIARAGVYGIAEALLASKVRLGFATFGEFVDALPLSTGRAHRARVLRAIDLSHLATVAGPAERCAYGLRRFYRPGLTTLIVSAWTGDPSQDLAPYLRRFGFPPILLSPSPLPLREGTGGLDPRDEALARRLETVERQVRLAEVWRFAPVIDWNDYWSLEGLARFLRRPGHRRTA